jgi:hypothetical protein
MRIGRRTWTNSFESERRVLPAVTRLNDRLTGKDRFATLLEGAVDEKCPVSLVHR